MGRVEGTPMLDPSMQAIVEIDATDRHARVVKDFIDTPASFDIAFDMRVDEYDAAHDVALVSVLLTQSATKSCILNVAIRTGNWTFDETCANGTTTTVNAPLQPLVVSGVASLSIGINYLQLASTVRTNLHIDNVTFDYP